MSVAVGLTVVSTVEHAAGITTQLLGLAALAVILSAVVALAYRSFADEVVPRWLAVLAGVSGVAVYLGTTPALETVVREGVEPGEVETALFNVGALVVGGGGALLGRLIGDRFGAEVVPWSPTQDVDDEVSQLAQTVGQVTTVSLPTQVDDAAGYDPIPARTKESLEGKKLIFPRGLTVDGLEKRVKEQLRSDYGIGTVDVEFDEGDVSYLAVGTRAAGIGSTLPPATNAVALRADPGFSASTGDIVQVWEPDSMQRILTGELRGVADDVVTIAIDAGDTPKVDPTRRYRLVTLPVEDRPDREFASLLRAAEETFSTVTVEAGSPLHGLPLAALDVTVTAVRPDDGEPVPFPDGEYRLAPGDLVFAIARPAALRRLEAAAEPLDPAVATAGDASLPTDDRAPTVGIQTADSTPTAREQPTGEDGLPAETTEEDDATESIGSGKADSESFKEIKAQFDETDDASEYDAEEQEANASDDETVEETGGANQSFEDLKAEFESGEADWDDEHEADTPEETRSETTEDIEVAFADDSEDDETDGEGVTDEGEDELVSLEDAEITFEDDSPDSNEGKTAASGGESTAGDEVVSLDEAEITFGDGESEDSEPLGEIDIDDELQGDSEEPLSDDIGNLEFDEDDSDDIDDFELDDEAGVFSELDSADTQGTSSDVDGDETDSKTDSQSEEDSEDEKDSEDDEDAEEGSGGGGGKSFADLKAEFESGEADWDDDVSDSPGGDMRLDE